MLHHKHGVADIAQLFERGDKLFVIPLMQPYGRLIQNVHNADKRAADLRGKAYALRFAAGKRSRAAGKRKIPQPDVFQEGKAGIDLFQYLLCDIRFGLCKLQVCKKPARFGNRELAQLGYIQPADSDGKRFLFEPLAAAFRAGYIFHKLLVIFPALVAAALIIALLNKRDYTLERGLGNRFALAFVAVHQYLISFLAVFFERSVNIEPVIFAHGIDHFRHISSGLRAFEAVAEDRPGIDRKAFIGYQLGFGYDIVFAEPAARLARAGRVVERKHTGSKLAERYPVRFAGIVLRKGYIIVLVLYIREQYPHHAAGKLGSRFDAFREPGAYFLAAQHKAVDNDLYIVLLIFVQFNLFGKIVHCLIHTGPHEPAFARILENLFVHTLFCRNDRGEHHKASTRLECKYTFDYLVHRLLLYRFTAFGAVRYAYPGIKQAQVIVYLRRRADSGARIARSSFLVDGYRR